MSEYERLRTHYPAYNVMHEQKHWDEHTSEIVEKRLDLVGSLPKLTGEEADRIRAMAALFVDDNRSTLLDFVVKHFDNKLASDIGEEQRKLGTPKQKDLIKNGLAALEVLAQSEYGTSFVQLTPEKQTTILVGLERDILTLRTTEGTVVPATAFFSKMLTETVSAYYSHPQVWSEIGYGGPAYPRGYVRIEFGLTDPWEAKRDA
ncbi:gluconate 2-dehydrogenase subunit 3 family protein [Tumebacillus sp. ITR2]|uniref:Gluconate 2-dehydrogenase subunit 3 family protein n=1 Tax=Tumebacillus amylolyticus TaxID=2801339 RepID=A0ABS1J6R3_9BACL|nr:gluconate 2-dehydrogenase subunit 3 family protein [Tumebacillus amylolyticus]MBL0385949.1 gluconate 2-dehydrogenase subunit 3 family protein [Tumebacillus amylolyticus]